jgi:hypothetical protein
VTIALDSQRSVRPLRRLQFCYLCGRSLEAGQAINDDHVPPSGIFAIADRDFPLILPTHKDCNWTRSQEDQVVSQLVGVLHGRVHGPRHNKLEFSVDVSRPDSQRVLVAGFQLKPIIRRWVRGFHAALYREFLPDGSRIFVTNVPLPEVQCDGDGITVLPLPTVVPKFVEEIKRNRHTRTLDRILCCNTKCRYECVWAQDDNETWICIYALDLYGWLELGGSDGAEQRGCVGCYRIPTGSPPNGAAVATKLVFTVPNRAALDPFAD